MAIYFFKHSRIDDINTQLESLTQSLRKGETIKAIHTPVVLPLNTSDEVGGYARSFDLPFGPKWIAVNCNRLLEESPSMREFILARQVALFDKSSRCLHLPIAVVAVVIAVVASNILFPSSMIAAVTIPAIVGLASAVIVAKKERENELYADLKAFRNCDQGNREDILKHFLNREKENSTLKNIFSGYPSASVRYKQLDDESNMPDSKN